MRAMTWLAGPKPSLIRRITLRGGWAVAARIDRQTPCRARGRLPGPAAAPAAHVLAGLRVMTTATETDTATSTSVRMRAIGTMYLRRVDCCHKPPCRPPPAHYDRVSRRRSAWAGASRAGVYLRASAAIVELAVVVVEQAVLAVLHGPHVSARASSGLPPQSSAGWLRARPEAAGAG